MPHVRRIRSVSAIAILFAAAAGAAACDVVVQSMDGGRAKAERVWTKTYTLAGSDTSVEIVNVNGSITVEAVDGTALDVRARLVAHGATDEAAREFLGRAEIAEETSAGKVRLEAKYPREPRRRGLEVTYEVRAPRTAKLILETVNGPLNVSGGFRGLRADSTNGGVDGKGLAGDVKASTTNGSIKIQMVAVGAGGVSLETTNGSIDLRLPADAKATVSARCVNGGIALSDLPFEKTGEGSRRKLDGRINGGGPDVTIETVNGGVRIGRSSQ
jgi:DUF4097 and DUF4098 domain-containing protein YvlB